MKSNLTKGKRPLFLTRFSKLRGDLKGRKEFPVLVLFRSMHRELKKGWMNEEGEETNSLRDVTNGFPVMGDLVMRTGIWDRQRAIIASRYKEM